VNWMMFEKGVECIRNVHSRRCPLYRNWMFIKAWDSGCSKRRGILDVQKGVGFWIFKKAWDSGCSKRRGILDVQKGVGLMRYLMIKKACDVF
jgi:hypothetical protein